MKNSIRNMVVVPTLCLLLGHVCLARTWVDDDGRKLNAELLENLHGHVTLETPEHKIIHVSISSLSAADQEYILSQTPPELEIDVVEITDRHNQGFDLDDGDNDRNDNDDEIQIQTNQDKFKATLTKDDLRAYNGTIKAEMYIMGKQGARSQYVLLSKTVSNVSFGKDLSDTFQFTSANCTFRDLESDAASTLGTEYAGYLVVLLDGQGRIFQSKGSRSMFEAHLADIRKMQEGGVIAEQVLQPNEL